MQNLLAPEQFLMEAQKARQKAQQAATNGDREFWQVMAERCERLAAYAEERRQALQARATVRE